MLVASTKHAAETLRVDAGVIHPGKLADIILVKGNPLESVLYLQNVELVIKAGVVQKAIRSHPVDWAVHVKRRPEAASR